MSDGGRGARDRSAWSRVFERARHPNAPRLDAAVHAYILAKRAEGVTDNTSENHAYQLRHLQNWCSANDVDLPVLTADHLRAFFNIGREHSAAAHWQAAKCVRAFFTWCAAEGISCNPTANIGMPRRADKPPEQLTVDQVQRLLAACTGDSFLRRRDDALVRFLVDTMVRVSELVGLDVGDIDLGDKSVRVRHGKGGKHRRVYFGERTRESLENYLRIRPNASPGDDALFVVSTGTRVDRDQVRKRLAKIAKRAGLAGVRVTPHRLRHTGATQFIVRGGDVFALQRLLGHATMTMTRRYVSLVDVDVAAAHRRASPGDAF